MIKQIKFKNYKAFKVGTINFKLITILLGTNSAGKSSIIQLILMLTQTFGARKSRNNALLLNGDFIHSSKRRH